MIQRDAGLNRAGAKSGDETAAAVGRRWERSSADLRCASSCGDTAWDEEIPGWRTIRPGLPRAQPDRTSAVCAHHARLPGHGVSHRRHRQAVQGEGENGQRTDRDRGHFDRGLSDRNDVCAADFLDRMPIVFDEHLPRWNYHAILN